MVVNVHRNHKVYRGRGEGRKGGMEVGEGGGYIPVATLSLHHQNDSCIKLIWAAMRVLLMFHEL